MITGKRNRFHSAITAGEDSKENEFQVNLRLLTTLQETANAGAPVIPTEANRTLGSTTPAIHRLYATLEDEGFIQREIDGLGRPPGQGAIATCSGRALARVVAVV